MRFHRYSAIRGQASRRLRFRSSLFSRAERIYAPEGADFVTASIQDHQYILRDPPGDDSYAFLEEGASIRTRTWWDNEIFAIKLGTHIEMWWGVKGEFFVGMGAGSIFKNENKTHIPGTSWSETYMSGNGQRMLPPL